MGSKPSEQLHGGGNVVILVVMYVLPSALDDGVKQDVFSFVVEIVQRKKLALATLHGLLISSLRQVHISHWHYGARYF